MSNKEQENTPEITEELSWTSHPFRDYPINSVLVLFVFAVMGYGLWQLAVITWDMPIFYYLGLAFFFISLLPYFIPTSYACYEYKIVIHYWLFKVEKRYEDFGCYYIDKKGVMLSTFKMPRRLDSFRGQSLRFSKTRAEKVALMELLDRKIGKKA